LASRLDRIANGDESAVREIIDEYGGLIWRLARRYLGGVPDEIDDAVQEVFVEIWLAAKRFDPAKGTEAAFVATLAHRRLIDHQRKALTRNRAHQTSAAETKQDQPVPILRSAVHQQVALEVAERFDELPEQERLALWLAVYRGMTHRQISEVTETPIGTVKTRLRNGLIRLGRMARPGERTHAHVPDGGAA
jgi:RNA polymerase sigma factor (sigma-70 family)